MPFRSILHVLFALMMTASIVCSIAIQAGHADVPIAESAALIEPLAKGDKAPRFVVETVDGEAFDFDPENLERPAVLLTFRGGWCPFCNAYLSDMRHAIPEIRAMGVDVLFLSGDRAELLFETLSQETQEDIDGLDYTLLSDADAQAAVALGIAFKASQRTINRRNEKGQDIEDSSMLKHGVLPVPAVFAIDRDGVINFAYTNADYKVRLPADELLAAAREIAAAD
ncbi:MAG: redoxin domain-containing protein [Gammaproteobacteria bacterium]|nr:redoxin domain-containing protein [Gammaproteobacteria bacterium]